MGDVEVSKAKIEMIIAARKNGEESCWVNRFPFEDDINFYNFTKILSQFYILYDGYNELVDLNKPDPWLLTGYNVLFFRIGRFASSLTSRCRTLRRSAARDALRACSDLFGFFIFGA
jgi:hypothetical protein